MLNQITKYGLYFIGLVLFQVLILNNVQFSGFINPYVYVLFLLMLPFETPGWLMLLLAFFLGFSIDVFPQGISGPGPSLGIHSTACLVIGFMRPQVLRWINPRDDYEAGTLPTASDYGLAWYFIYCLIMVGIHHFIIFFLEAFSLQYFFSTILRIIFSLFFTLLLLLIWEGFRSRGFSRVR